MVAVARRIDETNNAVQLNVFFLVKRFIFIICFLKVQLYQCIYLFLYSSMYIFLSYNFLALNISVQGFSFNFARILGLAVDKLLNGSRVNSHWQFVFGKRSLSLFRGNKTEGVICHIFRLDIVKTGLFFTFFS